SFQLFQRRDFCKQHRVKPHLLQCFQCIGRTCKVISKKSDVVCHSVVYYDLGVPNFSTACCTAGYFCAASTNVNPVTAASHACLIPFTPALIPPGCAMIPPPARYR